MPKVITDSKEIFVLHQTITVSTSLKSKFGNYSSCPVIITLNDRKVFHNFFPHNKSNTKGNKTFLLPPVWIRFIFPPNSQGPQKTAPPRG